jgi:hypothetical protein
MANIAIPQRVPGYAEEALERVRQARRYPILPLTVLIFLLIIPALFAGQLAPHHPTQDSSLSDRLAPRSGRRTAPGSISWALTSWAGTF